MTEQQQASQQDDAIPREDQADQPDDTKEDIRDE